MVVSDPKKIKIIKFKARKKIIFYLILIYEGEQEYGSQVDGHITFYLYIYAF